MAAKIFNSNLFGLLFFDVFWAICVIWQYQYLSIAVIGLVAYLYWLVKTGEIQLIQVAAPAALGILVDTTLRFTGIFEFAPGTWWLPGWLIVLWFGFSLSLTKGIAFFGKHWYVAALVGALGFPFSYFVGYKFGAVDFGYSLLTVMLLLALIWAVLTPLLFKLARGYQDKTPTEIPAKT